MRICCLRFKLNNEIQKLKALIFEQIFGNFFKVTANSKYDSSKLKMAYCSCQIIYNVFPFNQQ